MTRTSSHLFALAMLVACHGGSHARDDAAAAATSPRDAAVAVDVPEPPVETACEGPLRLRGPGSDMFVDGKYAGPSAPIDLPPGPHTVALASETSGYLWRRVVVAAGSKPCNVTLTAADRMHPRVWSALLVMVPSFDVAGCAVRASVEDLAAMQLYARHSFKLLEHSSYDTMSWTTETITIDKPLVLSTGESALAIDRSDPPEVGAQSGYADVVRAKAATGHYDVIVFIRRTTGKTSTGAACNTRNGFWTGYGWFDETYRTAIINCRLDEATDGSANSFLDAMDHWGLSDDVIISHEWFHTVEHYFPNLPSCCTEWPVHDSEHYGFPKQEGAWEKRFYRGTVPDVDHPGHWLGITPEAAHACTTRDRSRTASHCAR